MKKENYTEPTLFFKVSASWKPVQKKSRHFKSNILED